MLMIQKTFGISDMFRFEVNSNKGPINEHFLLIHEIFEIK